MTSNNLASSRLYNSWKQKYLGLGDENTATSEFLANVRKDTLNNLITHSASLEYTHLASGLCMTKRDTKLRLLRKMGDGN